MTMSVGDRRVADAIVSYVEQRLMARLGSGAFIDYRFGKVAVVAGSIVSVYLGGDTYASPNFRIPTGMTLVAGDTVQVAIDPRGDRYIAQKF